MEKQAILKEEKVKGGEKMKPILVVEDEAILRESLQDWLTDSGYQVETAEAGEEALEAIAEKDFGIVILDLRLPGKDGIEVLKEAKEKRPQLKGVIITAYPSVQTAVEAMKEGAIDYLPKPFELNDLEKLIRGTLGPVQVEIKPKAVAEEAVAEPAVVEPVVVEKAKVEKAKVEEVKVEKAKVEEVKVEKAKVEEVIAITAEEAPTHLEQGKAHFEAGRYQEALKEFQAVLAVAPGSIETRVWIQKTKQALSKPKAVAGEEAAPGAEEAGQKICLWAKMGMISHRICTNDYNCTTCEFDQTMQEKMASGEATELDAALERFKELPGNQRLCRYALRGDVSHRLCSRLFQCATCEFGQMMEDAQQQKLAKLEARREALRKKEQKAETKA